MPSPEKKWSPPACCRSACRRAGRAQDRYDRARNASSGLLQSIDARNGSSVGSQSCCIARTFLRTRSAGTWRSGSERNDGIRVESDVEASPGLIAEHGPIVAGSSRFLGEQNVARPQHKSAIPCFELQRAAQGDDELPSRVSMPTELRIDVRFMERHRSDRKLAAEHIASGTRLEVDDALFEVSGLVRAGPQSDTSDHLDWSL